MNQEETVDPAYQKRFNQGYLIAEHMPELAAQLKEAMKELDGGLKDGIEQFNGEKKKDLMPPWLKKDRLSSQDKGDKTGMDKDDLDRE